MTVTHTMAQRNMFRNAQKGITAKNFDEQGNEVAFDIREDEEMVRTDSPFAVGLKRVFNEAEPSPLDRTVVVQRVCG